MTPTLSLPTYGKMLLREKNCMPSKPSAKRPSSSTRLQFQTDWQEFLLLLISNKVRFLIVGGHAVSVHSAPRMTEDLDIFVDTSLQNVRRTRSAISQFGFGAAAPSEDILREPYRVFMIGTKPFRIDILNTISGVSFATAWKSRVRVKTAVGLIGFIAKQQLIRNKRIAGRPKDLADVAAMTTVATTNFLKKR
jgi:hypothetical protein